VGRLGVGPAEIAACSCAVASQRRRRGVRPYPVMAEPVRTGSRAGVKLTNLASIVAWSSPAMLTRTAIWSNILRGRDARERTRAGRAPLAPNRASTRVPLRIVHELQDQQPTSERVLKLNGATIIGVMLPVIHGWDPLSNSGL
jgi:hypothetical protein